MGRPRTGIKRVMMSFSLTPEQAEWLKAQAEGRSKVVQRLIDEARGKETK
jgi:hypothetical protein